jgi:glutaredoxin
MKIEVYGIDGCKWCEKTKVLLEAHGVEYDYHHVDDDQKKGFIDDFVVTFGGDRTFPRVLKTDGYTAKNDVLIGGFDQTLEAVLHGSLKS